MKYQAVYLILSDVTQAGNSRIPAADGFVLKDYAGTHCCQTRGDKTVSSLWVAQSHFS